MADPVDYSVYDPNRFFNIEKATPDEIKRFQADKGLSVDGVAGGKTTLHLKRHNASYPKPPPAPPKSPDELAAERINNFLRTKEKLDERAKMSPFVSWGVPALGLLGGGAAARHMANKATEAAKKKGQEVTKIGRDIIDSGVVGTEVQVGNAGGRAGRVTGAYDKMGKPDPFKAYDGVGKASRGALTNETAAQFFDRSISPTALKIGAAGGTITVTEAMRRKNADEAQAAFDAYLAAETDEEKLLYYERYKRAEEAAKVYETIQKAELAAASGFMFGRAAFPRGKPGDFIGGPELSAIRSEQRAVQDFYDRHRGRYGGQQAGTPQQSPGGGAQPQQQIAPPIAQAQGPLPGAQAPSPPPASPLPPPARSYTASDSRIVRDMLGGVADQGGDPRNITSGQISDQLRFQRGKAPPSTAEIDARRAATSDYLTDNPGTTGDDIRGWSDNKQYKGQKMLGLTGAAAGGATAAAALTPSQSEALESRVSGLMVSGKRIEDITARDVKGFVSDAEPAAIEAALMDMRGRAGERTNGRTQADQLRAIKDRSSPTGFRSPDGRFASPQ